MINGRLQVTNEPSHEIMVFFVPGVGDNQILNWYIRIKMGGGGLRERPLTENGGFHEKKKQGILELKITKKHIF